MTYQPLFAAGLLLGSLFTHGALAEERLHIDYNSLTAAPYLELAQNEGPAAPNPQPVAEADTPAGESFETFEEPWFNGNKLHKYLGIGSLALATLAVLSPKEEGGPHEYFAEGAAALGGAAVASGLTVHWDDIEVRNGISDPDNQHALLSTLGALGFLLAVSEAPTASHAGPGSLGYIAMAVGMRITW